MEITKEKSLLLKGVAINFMMLLHLFAIPERIEPYKVDKIFNIFGYGLEYYIGNFSSICVGIYLILSGYGFSKKYENKEVEFKEILKKILEFYKEYWKIFIIFIPLGFFLGVYQFSLKIFILNFISASNSYNGEWWFIKYYILFILTFYLLKKYNVQNILCYSLILFVFHFSSVFYKIEGITIFYRYCYWQLYFIIGIELSKLKYDFKLKKNKVTARLMILVLFFISSLITYLGKYEGLFQPIITIFFILFFINLNLTTVERKYLELTGKNSMNIWLFHSFFCFYYFKKYVYYLKNPILIYLVFMFSNIIVSILLKNIFKKFIKN